MASTRKRCLAGPRFARLLTPNFADGQQKTALNRHLYALSDRHTAAPVATLPGGNGPLVCAYTSETGRAGCLEMEFHVVDHLPIRMTFCRCVEHCALRQHAKTAEIPRGVEFVVSRHFFGTGCVGWHWDAAAGAGTTGATGAIGCALSPPPPPPQAVRAAAATTARTYSEFVFFIVSFKGKNCAWRLGCVETSEHPLINGTA